MTDAAGRSAAPVAIYLVRHGLTVWNRQGLMQGWTDVPLSETGRAQAERLAETLRGIRFERVITSDLSRAWETAEIITRGSSIPVERFCDLREYGCGEWEGRAYNDIRNVESERFWAWFNDPRVPMPGGESMAVAGARAVRVVREALAELKSRAAPLLVVAHGGINRLIAASLLDLDIEAAKRLRLDNASLSIFEPFLGTYALRLWNSVAHLEGLSDVEEGSTAARWG